MSYRLCGQQYLNLTWKGQINYVASTAATDTLFDRLTLMSSVGLKVSPKSFRISLLDAYC